jgi:DNA polymerase-3 subunit delta
MKIAAGRAEIFAAKPDPRAAAVLLYGPDTGLVRERALRLMGTVVADASDPFRVVDLDAALLKRDPARLADEAAAIAFGGGRRVVRIRDATDALADVLESFLEAASAGEDLALVIVEAGELSPRSSLRRLFEEAENAAAVACYQDEGAQLVATIRRALAEDGVAASDDALSYLAENLGADRAVTRSELAKLALYVGPGRTAQLEDAMACVGDSSALSLEDLAFAAADQSPRAVDRALGRALQEGVEPVSVVRAVARHFERLHLAAGRMAEGESPESAMAALRPPVFFKHKSRFLAQMRRWDVERTAFALERLLSLESQCKTTGLPAESVCRQGLLLLSAGDRAA